MTTRLTKPAADLGAGDHLYFGHVGDPFAPDVVRVLHAEPFMAGGVRRVTVLYGTDTEPHTATYDADDPITMATGDDIAAVADRHRRCATVDGLRTFAELIGSTALPLPTAGGLEFRIHCPSIGEVSRIAAALPGGRSVETYRGERYVEWSSHDADPFGMEGGVTVRWFTYDNTPEGFAYTRDPEVTAVLPVPAGVEGHPTGTRVPR